MALTLPGKYGIMDIADHDGYFFTTACNDDLLIRTMEPSQSILFGTSSNAPPAITVSQNEVQVRTILPVLDSVYDMGASNRRFNDIFVSGTLHASNLLGYFSGIVENAQVSETALQLTLTSASNDASYFVPFFDTATGPAEAYTNSNLTFNPSSGILASSFEGTLTGTASQANTINIVDDTSINSNVPLSFATGTAGYQSIKVSSSNLLFNPSTGTLSATVFNGSGEDLTNLNATAVSSGTLSFTRLPSTRQLLSTIYPIETTTIGTSPMDLTGLTTVLVIIQDLRTNSSTLTSSLGLGFPADVTLGTLPVSTNAGYKEIITIDLLEGLVIRNNTDFQSFTQLSASSGQTLFFTADPTPFGQFGKITIYGIK